MNNKLIISIYDESEVWAGFYKRAGYPVICWDKQIEGDILEGFTTLCLHIESTGLNPYGFIFQPPCTDFASSGARWWASKDQQAVGIEPFVNTTELSVFLVLICFHLIEQYNPKFWVLENPVGRIERLIPELKPYRRMVFNPCDYGDPYTKKTVLWGNFNTALTTTPVEPTLGSLMHKIPPSANRQKIRSKTPAGFAEAFFKANQ